MIQSSGAANSVQQRMLIADALPNPASASHHISALSTYFHVRYSYRLIEKSLSQTLLLCLITLKTHHAFQLNVLPVVAPCQCQ